LEYRPEKILTLDGFFLLHERPKRWTAKFSD
jgi:hypothetical protein